MEKENEKDNPAVRLLAILDEGKTLVAKYVKNPNSLTGKQAWKNILKIEESSTIEVHCLLLRRLGKVMELPSEIVERVKECHPGHEQTCNYWVNRVTNGLIKQNLDAPFSNFIGTIDDHCINYLTLTSTLLDQSLNNKVIGSDELLSIRTQFLDIYKEILSSQEIDNENMRRYLLKYLKNLINVIDEYFITGAEPILDEIQSAIGHAYLNSDYSKFLKDTEIGKKIINTLAAAASIVTVAQGMLVLTQNVFASLPK